MGGWGGREIRVGNSEIAETVLLFPFRPSGLPATSLQVKASALRFTSFTKSVIELTTSSFVLNLAIFRYKKKTTLLGGFSFYRNSEIRTHDLLLPKQALYQAELYSGDAHNYS